MNGFPKVSASILELKKYQVLFPIENDLISTFNLKSNYFRFFHSITGILNTLGELVIGWLGDRPNVNLNVLYAVCMVVCGGSTALVPFLSNYYALCCMAGLYGLCISGMYSKQDSRHLRHPIPLNDLPHS